MPNISVAMATYNGQKFIREQLDSIIAQLEAGDEIIVSDDGSTDETLNILKEYSDKFSFIKIFANTNRHGVVGNFENAISRCEKEYIFLSDQDDVWSMDKREKVLEVFKEQKCDLVLHNANIYLYESDSYDSECMYDKLGFTSKLLKVIWRNPYIGCCMAFKKELKRVILPIPSENKICIHDWWIAICAIKCGKVSYCKDKLIDYKIHSNNTLGFHKTKLLYKIKKRVRMVNYIVTHRSRFK